MTSIQNLVRAGGAAARFALSISDLAPSALWLPVLIGVGVTAPAAAASPARTQAPAQAPAQDAAQDAAGAPEAAPPAADLLARCRATYGDEEALAAVDYLYAEGDIEFDGVDLGGGFSELTSRDGRAYLSTLLPGMPAHDQGLIGDLAWEEDPMRGARVRDAIETDVARRKYGLLRHRPWQDLYVDAHVVGRAEVDGRACFELRMVPKLGRADQWFVDVETAELVRTVARLGDKPDQLVNFATTYRDWRAVDGVRYPFERIVEAGNSRLVRRVVHLEHGETCSPARFAPPSVVLGEEQPPGSLPRLRYLPAQRVLSMRMTCKPDEVGARMAEAVRRVSEALAARKSAPVGPPFTRYHSFAEDQVELEAGLPISGEVDAPEGLTVGELPAGPVLDVWHVGPLDRIRIGYAKLTAGAREFGVEPAGGQWEVYWAPPGREAEGLPPRVQLIVPVRGAGGAGHAFGGAPAMRPGGEEPAGAPPAGDGDDAAGGAGGF